MIIPRIYYAVRCDHPGCEEDTSTVGEDYTAWGDAGAAVDDWKDCDGQVVVGLCGVQHYCPDHHIDPDEPAQQTGPDLLVEAGADS